MVEAYLAYMDTPIGRMELQATDEGLTAAKFMFNDGPILPENQPHHPTLSAAKQQLLEYFGGHRKQFELPLAPAGTDFQKRVWQELLKLEWGETTTYLKQAEKLGSRLTIRAVGSANGKNPIWVIIPCHRVVASNGNLTGYAGGLWRKQWLLEHEGRGGQLSLGME